MFTRQNLRWVLIAITVSWASNAPWSFAVEDESPLIKQPSVMEGGLREVGSDEVMRPQTTNNMLWQQYQALQTGDYGESDCGTCSNCGAGGYYRCGCNTALFPWITGPGNCDQWCVGPKWAVDAGGLFMFRDEVNWNNLIAVLPGAPVPTLTDEFDHGPGARVFVTGYNDAGFGIQVGYEGINDWESTLAFAPGEFVAGETRDFVYQSRLNSVEINFLRRTESPWKLFSGFRYIQLDEDVIESRIVDKPIPLPVAAPPVGTPYVDLGFSHLLSNRLFGFQLGTQRDAWHWGTRFSVNTFANAGVYCNKFRRDDVNLTVTTVITADDLDTPNVNEFSQESSSAQTSVRRNFAEVAFVGEAGVAAIFRLNSCTAVRAGYQIMALDGVGQGLTASLMDPALNTLLNPGLNNDTVIAHGLQFGFEYRR